MRSPRPRKGRSTLAQKSKPYTPHTEGKSTATTRKDLALQSCICVITSLSRRFQRIVRRRPIGPRIPLPPDRSSSISPIFEGRRARSLRVACVVGILRRFAFGSTSIGRAEGLLLLGRRSLERRKAANFERNEGMDGGRTREGTRHTRGYSERERERESQA